PSHAIESRMPCTHSGLLRSASVSSVRRTSDPPDWRAKTQLNSADRAFPTWNMPVGEGAKRTRISGLVTGEAYLLKAQRPGRDRLPWSPWLRAVRQGFELSPA